MYKANPRVNAELRQRLPSPAPQQQPDSIHRAAAILNTDQPPALQNLHELQTSCSSSPVSHRRSVSPVSPPPVLMDPSPPGGGAGLRGPVDSQISASSPDKNVSFLLKELDALREVNNKLQEQLVQREKELQRREVEEELREEQEEARGWGRPAGLLEEVLAAQKDRDQAVMSRLLLANEERDEAQRRARWLQQEAGSETSTLEDADMDVEELLQQVCHADSAQEVQRAGSGLVRCLQLAQQRRSHITSEEMKAVMEERDESVGKWKRLEQNLLQDRQQQTREELLELQRQRDEAQVDRRRLEAELQALRANHSPLEAPPPQPPGGGAVLAPQAVRVQLQSEEKQKMEAELKRCREAEQEAAERVRRLERLVEVLRKKVGAGSVRAIV